MDLGLRLCWQRQASLPICRLGVPRAPSSRCFTLSTVESTMGTMRQPASPKYRHAPIVEAVLAIRTTFKSPPTADALTACATSLSGPYPLKVNLKRANFSFSLGGDADAASSTLKEEATGYRLTSKDSSRVVLIQDHGLTISHLAPYDEWSKLAQDGKEAWKIFVRECRPEAATRMALRYVNRIATRKKAIDIEDFLNVYPHLPEGAEWLVTGTFLQVQVPQLDLGKDAVAIINVALGEPDESGNVTLLLDIDVAISEPIDPLSVKLWDKFAQLRDRKNDLFERSITNTSRELFK